MSYGCLIINNNNNREEEESNGKLPSPETWSALYSRLDNYPQ